MTPAGALLRFLIALWAMHGVILCCEDPPGLSQEMQGSPSMPAAQEVSPHQLFTFCAQRVIDLGM